MKNYIQKGDTIEVIAPYDVTSGDGVLVDTVFGVASHDAVSGEPVQIKRTGMFEMAKTSAQSWTQGAAIYWDNTNKRTTIAATNNTLIGAATEVAVNPTDTGKLLLK